MRHTQLTHSGLTHSRSTTFSRLAWGVTAAALASVVGCSAELNGDDGSASGAGGTSGADGTGGLVASGGTNTGGVVSGTGASASTGGFAAGTGGDATGGAISSGGSVGTGGEDSSGGSVNTGGTTTGGANTGGTSTGGASTGGNGTGGASTGGDGTGGTSNTVCGRTAGSCSAPEVRVTEIDVGSAITPYGSEGDTAPLPMAIAALPGGGSRVAWLGTDKHVRIAELDCDDHIVGTPISIPAVDLQDLHADEDGGVVLVTREATGSGSDHCGTGPLCGGSSSPCYNMVLVRFDNAGNEVWARPVTNAIDGLDGYENGARFVWWYQHHGRIAYDGSNYGTYFCIGITVQNGQCVDIHEGDRMQVVSSEGSLVKNHPDAFEVGCSHSWQTRIVWDPRTNHFVTACVTDNNCRIARPSPYRTIAQGECDGTLFGGDLVLSSTPGYWIAWSQDGQIRLDHFTSAASDKSITNAGPSAHPHLVSYGTDNMLLTWGSGSQMAAQIRSAGSGDPVGSQFMINVPDHNYQAFKAFPDGSVAYPAAGSSSTKLKVARVMACE